MKTENLIRWGALAALASGALWIAGGILRLAYPQDPPGMLGYFLNYLGTAVFSAAYLGMLVGLAGLHARQMDSYGRLGRAGFLLGIVGAALAFVGQATSGIFPQNGTLGWLFSDPGFGFQAGVLLTSLGLLLMGIATTRAGVLPRWCGFGLVALVIFLALGAYGGFVVAGLIWLVLGYALGSEPQAIPPKRAAPATPAYRAHFGALVKPAMGGAERFVSRHFPEAVSPGRFLC